VIDQLNRALRNYMAVNVVPPVAWVLGENDWIALERSRRESDIMVELGIAPTRLMGLPVLVSRYAAGAVVAGHPLVAALRGSHLVREIP
jgi:hypothetical protein